MRWPKRKALAVVQTASAQVEGKCPGGRRKSTTLDSAPCYCGPGRQAGPLYVCVTCARFTRYWREVQARMAGERHQPSRWAP